MFLSANQQAVGKISFTADIWSDQNRNSYLCITGHWIERISGSLSLKSAMLAFQRLTVSHSGDELAKVVIRLLVRAGITYKVLFPDPVCV
jgi:hypothetical protein